MNPKYEDVKDLLRDKTYLEYRLNSFPFNGTPEIKVRGNKKYIYVRKRINGKLTSTYVGAYNDDLYNLLKRNSLEIHEINKQLHRINKELDDLGYSNIELSPKVLSNIDFVFVNLKPIVYSLSILDGISVPYSKVDEIINNEPVNEMTVETIQKINNLKQGIEFIIDTNILRCTSDYSLLSNISRIINTGLLSDPGRIRGVPVSIGGCSYIPPIPNEIDVKEDIRLIVEEGLEPIDTSIKLCLYCIKRQIFLDGNKRASIIFANHYLISKGGGFLAIPEKEVPEFKNLLVRYYEGEDISVISSFMKERCWKNF